MNRLRLIALLAVFLSLCFLPRLNAANTSSNYFVFHHEDGHIDADIQTGSLESLLENVAMATGWHVFLDPGAIHKVSAKFKDLPTGQALHILLGDVNFIVVPETNGPSRLFVFRTAQKQATRLIRAPAKPAKPIAKQLVVTLKPGSKTKIEDLARALGAKIIGRMDKQNTYLLEFDDDAATQAARAQLADNPDVAAIDYNYPIDSLPSIQASQQSSAPDLQLKTKPNDGPCPLVIGLIDTAIQPVSSSLNGVVLPPISALGSTYTPPAGTLTHGTAMLDTIVPTLTKMTKGTTSVKIQPIDVYGPNETTSTFNVAQGVYTAAANGADILNMSLGSPGDSSLLHSAIIQFTQQGGVVYAAAGNTPVTTPTYPAAYPEVVAVTASGPNGQIADYANRGSFVSMMAPGDNIVGFNGQSYQVEGTSTATAFASGMAAGIADNHSACADQAESLLKQSLGSTPIPTESGN